MYIKLHNLYVLRSYLDTFFDVIETGNVMRIKYEEKNVLTNNI